MNLLQAQSLAAGQQIESIQIYEKYFHLPFDKYITFGPWSKESKNYDLWNDVLVIILPELDKNNIKIVQIGGPNERPLKGTFYIAGQTNINQVAWIIKNSLLFFGADSFGQHLAGHYNIPLVDLIVNNYSSVVKPYFGDASKQVILEPPRDIDEKPTFSYQEIPKSINRIHPELIAKSILQLLNIEYKYPYQQIYLGDIYLSPMIISACDSLINPQQVGVDSLILDLTLNHNEQILLEQLQICPGSLLVSNPLSQNILDFHKSTRRIREIVYLIQTAQNSSPDFIKKVAKYGIPLRMISTMNSEDLNIIKLDYMDIGTIFKKPEFSPEQIKELEGKKLESLFFKSSKFYVGRQKIYPSKKHYIDDKNIGNFDEISPIINDKVFWNEIDSFRILERTESSS